MLTSTHVDALMTARRAWGVGGGVRSKNENRSRTCVIHYGRDACVCARACTVLASAGVGKVYISVRQVRAPSPVFIVAHESTRSVTIIHYPLNTSSSVSLRSPATQPQNTRTLCLYNCRRRESPS